MRLLRPAALLSDVYEIRWDDAAGLAATAHLAESGVLSQKHPLAAGILETINAYLRDKGCESGAPVPGDQTPARLCEDSLSWLGQEHGATDHAICAV